MTKANINSKKGFTIIEVVLVLAIAGLIFLMVFVALPNLRRSQRDTERRNHYANLMASIEGYVSSHGGELPKAGAGGVAQSLNASKYITSEGKDPSDQDYNLFVINISKFTTSTTMNDHTVYVVLGANCSGDNKGEAFPKEVTTTGRHFVIYGGLETGTYCQENN